MNVIKGSLFRPPNERLNRVYKRLVFTVWVYLILRSHIIRNILANIFILELIKCKYF